MSDAVLPSRVQLCDVGPRDGFQFEDRFIPTARKLDIIAALADAGLPRLQVASFVHPKWVPQMRDAEAVCAGLPDRETIFAGLVLNPKGLQRALATDLTHIDLSIATHDRHSYDNANMSVVEAVQQAEAMVADAHDAERTVQMGFQTVFGYQEPGDTPLGLVVELSQRFADLGVAELSLADSTGMANPRMIQRRVDAVRAAIGDTPIVLHLHDTRGLGLANVYAALEVGVTRFDTSLAGMGGCPFIDGATGNIATEDTAYLMQQLGIETGVDIAAVAAASNEMETFLETSFPGTYHRLQREAMG